VQSKKEKKMKEGFVFKWGYAVMAIALLSVCCVAIISVLLQTAKPDPDRARFMLECTYDWMLSPEQCRDILGGKDPVTPPPEAGC
jgi:hypothetical protein